jgi:Family of unknown function (DUF6328)
MPPGMEVVCGAREAGTVLRVAHDRGGGSAPARFSPDPPGYQLRIAPETEKECADRQLIELLNELRVALPGAQVLLGFLLTVPFATRFGRTTRLERATLFARLLLTVGGTLLLMAATDRERPLRDARGDRVRRRRATASRTTRGCRSRPTAASRAPGRRSGMQAAGSAT